MANKRIGFPTSDSEWLRLHVEALFIHDDDGRLVCANEPERRPAPRFYLGCAADGVVMRFRVDLEEGLVQALDALCSEVVPDADGRIPTQVSAKVESLLAEAAPIERRWSGLGRYTGFRESQSSNRKRSSSARPVPTCCGHTSTNGSTT